MKKHHQNRSHEEKKHQNHWWYIHLYIHLISRWGAKPITGRKTSPSSTQGKLPTLNFKLQTSRSEVIRPNKFVWICFGAICATTFSSIMYIPLPRSKYIFMLIRLKKSIGIILFSKTSPYIATKLNSAYQVLMMIKWYWNWGYWGGSRCEYLSKKLKQPVLIHPWEEDLDINIVNIDGTGWQWFLRGGPGPRRWHGTGGRYSQPGKVLPPVLSSQVQFRLTESGKSVW